MVKYESPLFDVVEIETEDIILASGNQGGVTVNPDTGNAEGEGDEF